MAIYPEILDDFTPRVDYVDDVMAADVNELQAAIEALEAKVGIDGSEDTGSIDYKVNTQASMTANGFLSALDFEHFSLKQSGRRVFYFDTGYSDKAPYNKILYTPNSGITSVGATNITNGQVIGYFLSEPTVHNETYIPAGLYDFGGYMNLQGSGVGEKSLQVCAEIWETDASGTDIRMLATTNYTDPLTSTAKYYKLQVVFNGVYYIPTTSRILVKLIANVWGSGTNPAYLITCGGSDAGYVALPSNMPVVGSGVLTASPISGTGLVGDPITINHFFVDDTQLYASMVYGNYFVASSGNLEAKVIMPDLSGTNDFFKVNKDTGIELKFITSGGYQNNTWFKLEPTRIELNYLGADGTSAYNYLVANKTGEFQILREQSDGNGGNIEFSIDNTSFHYNNNLDNGDGTNNNAVIFDVSRVNGIDYRTHKQFSDGRWNSYNIFNVNAIGEMTLSSVLNYGTDLYNNCEVLRWSFNSGFEIGSQVVQGDGSVNNDTTFQVDSVGNIYNRLMVNDTGTYYNVDGLKFHNDYGFSLGFGTHYNNGSVMSQTRLTLNPSGALTITGLAYDYSGYPQSSNTFVLGQYGGLTMSSANYDGNGYVYWNDIFSQTQQGALQLYGIDQSAGGYPSKNPTLFVDNNGAFKFGASYYSQNQNQVFQSYLLQASKYGDYAFYSNPASVIQYDADTPTNQTAEDAIVVTAPSSLVLNVVAGNLSANTYSVKVYAVRSFYGKTYNGALQGSVADLVYNNSYISGSQVLSTTGGFTIDWTASTDRDAGYVIVVDDGTDIYYKVVYNNSTVYADDNTWTAWDTGSPTITNTSGATVPGSYNGDSIEYTVWAGIPTPLYQMFAIQQTPSVVQISLGGASGVLISWDWQSGVQYVIQKTVNGTTSSYYSCAIGENYKVDDGTDFPNVGEFPYGSFDSTPITEHGYYPNQLMFNITPDGAEAGNSIDDTYIARARWQLTKGTTVGADDDVAYFNFFWSSAHKTNVGFGGETTPEYPIDNAGTTKTYDLMATNIIWLDTTETYGIKKDGTNISGTKDGGSTWNIIL